MHQIVNPASSPLGARLNDSSQVPTETECSRTVVNKATAEVERKVKRAAPFEPTSPEKVAGLAGIHSDRRGVSKTAQTLRPLEAMRKFGEISRMEAERYLGIGHAPRRLKDLADDDGHLLAKRWIRQVSESGSEHRTVAYSLAVDAGEVR